jgi:hypothetical protein
LLISFLLIKHTPHPSLRLLRVCVFFFFFFTIQTYYGVVEQKSLFLAQLILCVERKADMDHPVSLLFLPPLLETARSNSLIWVPREPSKKNVYKTSISNE